MNVYLQLDCTNKAKEDIDAIMAHRGFCNKAIGSRWKGKVGRFFAKFLSVYLLLFRLKKDDVLLVQYPFKKYYPSLCRIAHLRGARVITLIHDLGCFRRKKLTVQQEIRKLSLTDVLIVHNDSMMAFLRENGYAKPMVSLEIFDYLSPDDPTALPTMPPTGKWEVVYAGGLAERKNRFLYLLDGALPDDCCWNLNIHGKGLDEQKAAQWKHVTPRGFIRSDDFVRQSVGQFGLVWDGASIDECSGDWGIYLKVNNPHKTSFYLRSGKPVIIWRDAALARFVEEEGVGITVHSLSELHQRLLHLSAEEYGSMVVRTRIIQQRLSSGYYFNKAFDQASALL